MELSTLFALFALAMPIAHGAPAPVDQGLHPDILVAMKRDLGLDARQANARVAFEKSASNIIETLRASTGASFAGAWVSPHDGPDSITIAITDDSVAGKVIAAGAIPKIVKHKLSMLVNAKEALDELQRGTQSKDTKSDFSGIGAWYVDEIANKVVLETLLGNVSQAKKLAQQVGLSGSEFTLKVITSLPTSFATTSRGGDTYYIPGSGACSVGFSVNGGFVSAGHCSRVGQAVTTRSNKPLGTTSKSVFPGSDMNYITTGSDISNVPQINAYNQGSLPVRGSNPAAINSSVCRSGGASGVTCGVITATGASVAYGGGTTVTGLTSTTACGQSGDSGGPFYSGDQGQGVLSGGNSCTGSSGTTFFQPLGPILSRFGLSLVVSP